MTAPDSQLRLDVEALVHRAGCPVAGPVDGSDWCLPVEPFLAFAREEGGWSADEVRAAMDTYAIARGGQRVPVRTAREAMIDGVRRLAGQPPLVRREVWMVPMPARPVGV